MDAPTGAGIIQTRRHTHLDMATMHLNPDMVAIFSGGAPPSQWSSDWSHCCADPRAMAEAMFCPCCFLAHMSEQTTPNALLLPTNEPPAPCEGPICCGSSILSLFLCAGLAQFSHQTRLLAKMRFNIPRTEDDQTIGCCCCMASNAQISRELTHRNLHGGSYCVPRNDQDQPPRVPQPLGMGTIKTVPVTRKDMLFARIDALTFQRQQAGQQQQLQSMIMAVAQQMVTQQQQQPQQNAQPHQWL